MRFSKHGGCEFTVGLDDLWPFPALRILCLYQAAYFDLCTSHE